MKTKLKTIMFPAGLLFAGLLCWNSYRTNQTKHESLMSENIEALSWSGEGGTNYAICNVEGKVHVGYTYWNCGDCTERNDEEGKGHDSKCYPR